MFKLNTKVNVIVEFKKKEENINMKGKNLSSSDMSMY